MATRPSDRALSRSGRGSRHLYRRGVKNQPGAEVRGPANIAERRARAYTLFVRAYDQCRRAVTYLRWNEGDADEIAPSLFANRGSRKPSAEPEAPEAAPAGPASSENPEA